MTRNSHPPLGQVFLPMPCDGIICQPRYLSRENVRHLFVENVICFIDDIALITNGSFEIL
jgi:hypothetical protein